WQLSRGRHRRGERFRSPAYFLLKSPCRFLSTVDRACYLCAFFVISSIHVTVLTLSGAANSPYNGEVNVRLVMPKVPRLLERIVPEFYRLMIDLDLEKFRFRAHEELEFELKQPGRQLTLHAVKLKVGTATLDGEVDSTGVKMDKDAQTVTFSFGHEVEAGQH